MNRNRFYRRKKRFTYCFFGPSIKVYVGRVSLGLVQRRTKLHVAYTLQWYLRLFSLLILKTLD